MYIRPIFVVTVRIIAQRDENIKYCDLLSSRFLAQKWVKPYPKSEGNSNSMYNIPLRTR